MIKDATGRHHRKASKKSAITGNKLGTSSSIENSISKELMAASNTADQAADDTKTQIVFEYYKQQREEFLHLVQERSSITIQLLLMLGALGAVFFQTDITSLKVVISGVIIMLGLTGLLIFRELNKSCTAHVRRARAARKSLAFLEEFSEASNDFGRPYRYYAWLYILIMFVGFSTGLLSLI